MLKKLLSAALFCCVGTTAFAGNTPLTIQIDRTLDPSPICVLRTTTGACTLIGYVSSTGVWTPTGPGGGTFAASAYTDTTNAGNISSGKLPAARLPVPTVSALGGVYSVAAPLNQFQTGIDTTGAPTFAQAQFTSLGGQISSAQVPTALALNSPSLTGTPSTPGLTGYLYGNGGTGWTASPTVPTAALSGTLQVAQAPALTGDVTSTAGSFATTIQPNAVTSAKMASGAAYGNLAANSIDATKEFQAPAGTLRGNLTGATANVADSTLSAHMDAAFGTTRGSILYRGATGWVSKNPGTAGAVFTSAGPGADPDYIAPGATAQLAGFRNRIINGDMRVDQRNNGAAQTLTGGGANAYTVDRFYAYASGANATGQRVAGSGSTQYRYQLTGAAGVTGIGFGQRIEAANSYDLAGGTALLSVDLANSVLTSVTWVAYYAASTDSFGSRTQIAAGSFTVSSTLGRYSATISVPAAATTGIEILLTVGAQTSGTWTIGNVQLEPGAVATSFEKRPIGFEMGQSQRYYTVNAALPGIWGSTTVFTPSYTFPVAMRASPSITLLNGTGAILDPQQAQRNVTSIVNGSQVQNTTGGRIDLNSSAAPTAQRPGILEAGTLAFSAEL